MNDTMMILLALLVIYIPIWIWAKTSERAKRFGLECWGPAVKINTKLGIKLMDRLAKYHRFWNVMGVFSQIVAVGLMAMMVFVLAIAVINLPTSMKASAIGIEYALAIPGLNPLMPFWYALLAFIIALVFHEFAHGLQARSNDIGVVHTGLLYGVVPLGAFVEPDPQEIQKASRKAQLHLYAAGICMNFIIAVIAFSLMASSMACVNSPYDGNAGVYNNQDSDGIPAGAIIVDVDGNPFDFSIYTSPLRSETWTLGIPVTVTYKTSQETTLTKTVQWGARIAGVVKDSPAEKAGLVKGDVIVAFGDSTGTFYIYTANAFSAFMKTTHPGDTITVTYVHASETTRNTVNITLTTNSSIGFLGVTATSAGMNLVTPEQVKELGINPFYGRSDVAACATGLISFLSHPFQGFTPVPEALQWWYNQPFFGFWDVMCSLYWIFWLNILLGITNAIPAVPFDGGYIFRGWVDGILERRGVTDTEGRTRQVEEITRNVSALFLFVMFIVLVAALT